MVIGTLVGIASGHFGGSVGVGPGAAHRLVPGDPVPAAGDRAGDRARVVAAQRHHRHRRDLLAGHGAAGAGADPVGRGPALPRTGPGARRRALAPDVPARAAQRDAAGARQHHPDGRDRDPLRDDPVVPRPRRPVPGVLGLDAGRRVRRRVRSAPAPGGTCCRPGLCVVAVVLAFTLVGPGAGERARPPGARDDDAAPDRGPVGDLPHAPTGRCPPYAASTLDVDAGDDARRGGRVRLGQVHAGPDGAAAAARGPPRSPARSCSTARTC